ncbi:MFS transporter [Fictibacillus iocasae]|uniref:MFS transporter n=1 Tax=Fictibacillus iocasae TaxID=2715437 RepID=A0ABW2NQR6_9BACL
MEESKGAGSAIQENRIIPLWSLTVWLVVMNTTMFNVALPSVIKEFELTPATGSWIVSGYSIVFALSTITFSRLSDFIPIGRLLLTGVAILGLSSAVGFFSDSFAFLLASRVLQAMGAGAVPGLAMVLATRYIPVKRRGKAMSLISSAASLGFGLGPVIGGAVTQYLGWNDLFLVTALVLLLIPLFKKYLPVEQPKKGEFDLIGALLTGVGVSALLLFLSTFNVMLFLVSAAALVTLVVFSKRKHDPFIQISLFANRRYRSILLVGLMAFMTHFAFLFVMPVMLAKLFGQAPASIGFIIFPGAMLSALAATYIGRFIDRFGNLPIMRFGLASLFLSAVLFTLFGTKAPVMTAIFYMFTSVGFSSLTSSLANEASRILHKDVVGTGMGLMQLVQFFGGAFGVAAAGLLVDWQKALELTDVFRNIFLFFTLLLVLAYAVYYFGIYKNREMAENE